MLQSEPRTPVNVTLAKELEKARKAQRTAATLQLISGALTMASQAVSLKASLGSDAPAGAIDKAKTPADLQKIANDVQTSAMKNVETLEVQFKGFVDQGAGSRVELLEVLRSTKYPINQVPELRLY